MSLQFPQDTSTQLTYSSFPFTTLNDNVNPWSKSTSNTDIIYNTSLANGRIGIATSSPTGMLDIHSTYINFTRLKFGHYGRWAVNQIFCDTFYRFITSRTASDEIAYFGYVDSYDDPVNRTMVLQITRTALNMTGDIYASGNAGIGVSPSATYKLNVNGSINSTSFYQNGTLIDFSSYATNTNLTNNYYNKTNIDSLLNAKQQAITTYTISTGSSGGSIGFSTSTSTFTLAMPNDYTQNMSISNLITPTSFIYKGTELSTTLGTYATTTQLNNNISNVYTNNIIVYLEERPYPPKLYNSVTAETTTTFLGKSVYTQTITLNTTDISYGSGDYIIYSSSTYGSLLKHLLFDLSLTNPEGSAFQGGLYNSPSGIYNGANFIVSGYTGDWIILKLPVSIILTKFSFKERSSLIQRAPAEWKCYGSNDGITFTEIIEASQSTRLTASDYPSGLYTKTLNTSFNTPYLYIGWTFNKIVGGLVNSDMVNFNEIQIYGKERATPFYISSNVFNSTLTNYSTTAINDNNYLKKIGGNMTGDINMNSTSVINFGQRGDDNLIKLWTNGADTYGFGINAYTLRYNTPNGASHKFYTGTTNVATINSTGNITASSFSGDGANITNLNYNNIALNKPTNFQTDWNTTIINKPTNFQTDWNTTIINKPTNFQTDWNTTIINKPTNFQTDWNTTIINKPTYFPIDPATYYNKSEINGLSTLTNFYNKSDSDGRFLQLSGGTMTGALTVPNITLGNGGKINTYDDYHYIQISQLTDTITIQEWGTISFNIGQTKAQKAYINASGLTATAFYGNGANITNIAYTNITGTPSIYTQSQSDARYLQLSGGTMTGNLTATGIALSGSDAFVTESSPYPVNTENKTNTYINFKNAGSTNDWCYLRQIGGVNAIKLTLDFHDDSDDARFCIRSINSVASPDVATEVFTVDSGNVSCTGTLTANSFSGNGANITNITYGNITGTPSIYTQSQSDARYLQLSGGTMTGTINMTTASTYLNFGTRAENFHIKLFGDTYGFGVNAYTLRYNADSGASHKFYSGSANTAIIDSVGNMLVGNANTYPHIQLGSTNGHNWGVATAAGHFSSSAAVGDMVLRSLNKLILQSGGGGYALMINADNSISCSGALTLSGALNLTGVASGNNPLYISSTNTTANNCIQIKNNSTYTAYIGIGGTAFTGNYANNLFIESASSSIIFNTNGRNSQTAPNLIIDTSGNVGLGVLNPSAKLNVYGTTQLQPKISLTGIEYYTGTNTNADGIGLMLGVNRTNNRQLFICDTSKLTQNTTNSMIRMGVGGGDTFIDSMATDGATRLGLNLANSFYCQANNYGSMNKFLKFHGVAVGDDRPTMEGLIFNEGATVGGTFAGDTFISGYWGVAVLLNSGGFANGIGGNNNGRSYIPGYSAFTINMRSATSQTTFDKNIFIVYPDGQVYMKNMVSLTATDNSYIKCGANANGYYLNVGSTSSASSTMYDAVSAGIWTSFAGGLHLNACTNNNNVYVNFYNTGGLFSVGGAVPSAKLHVGSGTASTGNILQKYYSVVLNDQSLIYQTLSDVCAIFDSSVWCKSKYSVSSDERIKKNIQDINDDSALQKILLIQPKTYEYIDKVERGNSTVYGFIAQQIKEIIPEAIQIEKSIIPNIFKICNYNYDIISIPEEDIPKLKVNDEIEIIIEDDNNKRLCKIIEINDNNTIKINEILSETEVIKECFVYGSKVDDFHTLDKNYIYTLNVCATQELYKLIQSQQKQIEELQQRLSILETR